MSENLDDQLLKHIITINSDVKRYLDLTPNLVNFIQSEMRLEKQAEKPGTELMVQNAGEFSANSKAFFPCQLSRRANSASMAFKTSHFFRLHRGAMRSSGGPSPVSR